MILKAMIKKELMEMFRNYKIILVPILFMFLGAIQPITYYYLPDILKMASLPEGAVLQIPTPTPNETMLAVFSQFNQLGIFILILVSMGTVANEVKSGVAENILVKPIPIKNYLLSKYIAYFSLTILSTSLGILIGKFYTTQLIGEISTGIIIKSTAIYLIYLLFIVGITILLSSILDSSIFAGGIAIIIAIFLSIFASLPFDLWYLPSNLLRINQKILFEQPIDNLWLSIIAALLYIIITFYLSVTLFTRKQLSPTK